MRESVRGRAASTLLLSLALGVTGLAPVALTACGGAPETDTASVQEAEATDGSAREASTESLADGSYEIEVTTDSSMFRAAHCTLEVGGGTLTAHLALPGEGFSRIFFGSAADAEAAAAAGSADVYDYHLGEDGLYTFDLPVLALDTELQVAAFGQRRDTWYDHTITFASPAVDAQQ